MSAEQGHGAPVTVNAEVFYDPHFLDSCGPKKAAYTYFVEVTERNKKTKTIDVGMWFSNGFDPLLFTVIINQPGIRKITVLRTKCTLSLVRGAMIVNSHEDETVPVACKERRKRQCDFMPGKTLRLCDGLIGKRYDLDYGLPSNPKRNPRWLR